MPGLLNDPSEVGRTTFLGRETIEEFIAILGRYEIVVRSKYKIQMKTTGHAIKNLQFGYVWDRMFHKYFACTIPKNVVLSYANP